MTCGANTKGGTGACKLPPVPGSKRCRLHGGLTPKGAASPHFIHGERSRATSIGRLPARYREAFANAIADGDRMSALTDQIAIVDVREAELLGRLSPEGNTARWHMAAEALDEMEAARHMPDGPRKAATMAACFGALQDSIRTGVSEEQVWRAFYENVEVRRRLVETERRRIEGLKAYLTIEQAFGLMGRIVGLIKEAGIERRKMAYIVDGIQMMIDPGMPNPMTQADRDSWEDAKVKP